MDYKEKYESLIKGLSNWRDKWCKTITLDGEIMKDFDSLIPKFSESEDERIRREINNLYSEIETCITELLKARADKDSEAEGKARFKMEGLMVATHEELSCIEAYLEEQKEQKHPNGCFTCDEYKKGYEAGRSNGFTAGYNKAMKEQKPVDEPFEEWIDGWYNEHHRDGYITMDEREFKNFCRGIKNIYQQKPAEWSEEDEKNLENIKIYLLHHGEDSWADTIIKLKSLRPQLQMLEDWTSEDDELLADVLGCITLVQTYKAYGDFKEFKMGHTGEELRSFVRSLKSRPRKQPHWKPSKEQMDALEETISQDCAVCNGDRKWIKPNLESLYEQLKKMKAPNGVPPIESIQK